MESSKVVGIPDGVINYIPGPGGVIGDYLVEHPLVRMIAFTGSKEVGIRIYELASKVRPGQKFLKRVSHLQALKQQYFQSLMPQQSYPLI